uniref:PLD phosphodiesterase domain-containing protein n=1 Tax=Quercus lobata TaxID=97700 RepID=A0A7N2KU47_QUELO
MIHTPGIMDTPKLTCNNLVLKKVMMYTRLQRMLLIAMLILLSHSGVYPDYATEPSNLASGRPNMKNVTLLLSEWYGSGIVHAKVWISDRRDVYIGSANQDWKSLTQVKELGIYLAGCPTIAKMVETYFDNLWKLAFLNSSAHTKTVWDEQWKINRTVPFWSYFIYPKERCRSPLPPYVEIPLVAGYPTLSDPYMFKMSIQTPGYSNSTLRPHFNCLSFSPPEEVDRSLELIPWIGLVNLSI